MQVSNATGREPILNPELPMYTQTEYGLAYALIFGLLILGLLVVCVPRPRKKELIDPNANKNQRKRGSAY